MDMSKLESSTGHDFDMSFMDTMIKHHQDGINMAKDSEGKLQKKELKDFSRKMAKNQQIEISKMEKWKSSMNHQQNEH